MLQEQRARDQSDKLLSNLKHEYVTAQKDIQRHLDDWYKKYANENGISPAQARKKLTAAEQRQHVKDIDDYIAKAKTGDARYEQELRRRYITSRVSRLQALQDQAAVQLELLGKSQDVKTYKLLQETYKDTYYRSLHSAASKIGINGRFDRFSTEAIEQICKTPWSGKSFSERIWGNNKKLIKEVRNILSQGTIQGSSIDKMSHQLVKRMGVDYHRAECLIRTESAYIQGQATADAYAQMGVTRYQYLATLDGRTSQVCRRLDNQVFDLAHKALGVNYPPMHPRCRSTTIPYYDNEFTEGETRAARDASGQTIKADAKMSYNDWHQSYVDNPMPLIETGLNVFIGAGMYDMMSTKDWQQMAAEVERMPPEHLVYINEHVQGIDHCSASPYETEMSHYDWINRVIYLRDELEPGEFVHELGHLFEYELKIYENAAYADILETAVAHAGSTGQLFADASFVTTALLVPDNGAFMSDNQRIVDMTQILQNGMRFTSRAMTEYLAEGYRYFITAPDELRKKNKALYDFIAKELVLGGR